MTRTPSLASVMLKIQDNRLSDLHVALPCIVESYDATKQKVSVSIALKNHFIDEFDNDVLESFPVIPDVPVCFPGSGAFRIVFPIKKGDSIAVIFSEMSLDVWLSSGGIVDPKDDRRNHLTDAIAIPGLRDFAHPIPSAPTDKMYLGNDDAFISIDDTAVRLNTMSGQLVALSNKVDSVIDTIRLAHNLHVHGVAGTPPTTLISSQPSTAAADVYAKE